MTAGSGSGEGRLQKTDLQQNKRKRVKKQYGGGMGGLNVDPLTGQPVDDWSKYLVGGVPANLYGAYAMPGAQGAGLGAVAAKEPDTSGVGSGTGTVLNQGANATQTIQEMVRQNMALQAQQDAAQQQAAQYQAAQQKAALERQQYGYQPGQSIEQYNQAAIQRMNALVEQQKRDRDIAANQNYTQFKPDFSKYIPQAVKGVGLAGYSETNPFGLTDEDRKALREQRGGPMTPNERRMQYALMNQQKAAQGEMLRRMKLGMSEQEAGEYVKNSFADDFQGIRDHFAKEALKEQVGKVTTSGKK